MFSHNVAGVRDDALSRARDGKGACHVRPQR
jgi:hypothetical protein